jgi:hypothetical protein
MLARRFLYSDSMFARRLSVKRIDSGGQRHPCPIRHIDSFAMRNFTNDAAFDDTFPAADGLLEAGHRVPLDRLHAAMEDWFRRKGYLKAGERLEIVEEPSAEHHSFTVPVQRS